jgi:hypothetical protein
MQKRKKWRFSYIPRIEDKRHDVSTQAKNIFLQALTAANGSIGEPGLESIYQQKGSRATYPTQTSHDRCERPTRNIPLHTRGVSVEHRIAG